MIQLFRSLLRLSTIGSLSCQRVVNIRSSGVYFKYLGDLKVQNDKFVLTTFIDLNGFHNVSKLMEVAISDCTAKCLEQKQEDKNNVTNLECYNSSILNKIRDLKRDISKDLDYLYQTLGKKVDDPRRRKRDLGAIGMGFGIENHKSLDRISEVVDQIRMISNQNFKVVKSELSNQDKINKVMREELEGIAVKVNIHENRLNLATEKVKDLEETIENLHHSIQALKLETVFEGLRLDFVEISHHLKDIKQAISGLSANSLHSSIITPGEMLWWLQTHRTYKDFLAVPSPINYPTIAKTMKGEASLDVKTKMIKISIEVPLYDNQNRLYEIINLPMIRDNRVLYVPNNDKYCVITENKRQFYCMEQNHDYIKINDFYVCDDAKKLSFLPTSKKNKCIINIFRGRSFENCQFKEIPRNIEIFKKLEANTHLFALRDPTKYKYECMNETHSWNNFDRIDSFSGTGVLYMALGCKFYTKDSTIDSDKWVPMQDKLKNDVYNFGLDRFIEHAFGSYVFSKNTPVEKSTVALELLKTDDSENEVSGEVY